MAAFFASGHAVDLVLLVIAVEYALLTLRRAAKPLSEPLPLDGGEGGAGVLAPPVQNGTLAAPPALFDNGRALTPIPALAPSRGKGSRSPPLDGVLALMPGVCMLLALRAALTASPWPWIAVPLAASFPFHIADLVRRRL